MINFTILFGIIYAVIFSRSVRTDYLQKIIRKHNHPRLNYIKCELLNICEKRDNIESELKNLTNKIDLFGYGQGTY